MRDYLIVARVGDKSLHPLWLAGQRNWDLALSCFGTWPPERMQDCVVAEHVVGPKWGPLHDFIARHADLIAGYRYVLLPDDDLLFSSEEMSRFFSICARHGFAVAQPSLDYDSFYSHPITIRRPLLSYRITDFVEVMAPCFRRDSLMKALPTFLASSSGWGIDDVWPGLLGGGQERFAIVDEVSVTHTRPVGGELYRGGALSRSPHDDYAELHASGVASLGRRSLRGYMRGGLRVPALGVKALGLLARAKRRGDGHAVWTNAGPVAQAST